MPSLRHSSKAARTPIVLLAMLFTILAVMAVRPLASLAAPVEPPAEPEAPQLVIEPGSYDFGLQPLNRGSRENNFTLRNAGGEAFQVGSPSIVGPGQEAFWADYSPCYGSNLQPGESCSVRVYFGPRDAVAYDAQFQVSVGSYSFSAQISGTGGRASFAPSSNPTDFGVAKVGSAGTTRQIEIANTGNMPGGMFIAVIAGGAIGSFQILDESCTGVELVPAATCTLQVGFQPVSEGVKKATLGLFGESEGPTAIVLSGVGTAPDSAPAPIVVAAPMTGAAAVGLPRAGGHRRMGHRRNKRHRLAVHDSRLVLRAPTKAR